MQRTAREVLASFVVFLVALPLCMGVAIASGVPPAMGLVSGVIGGIVVGTLAGSPLQVSGPAAGLAVIVWEIVHEHGLEALAPIVVLAGLIQLVAGRLGLGIWFRAVSPAVIYAMLAGIGILIFASQFHVMVDDAPAASGIVNLVTIPAAVYKGIVPLDGSPHHLAAAIGLTTLVLLVAWNKLKPRLGRVVGTMPAPLVAVVAATGAAAAFSLPIQYVQIPGSPLDMIRVPRPSEFGMLLQPAILGSALAVAAIASAESLLCASAVDKLHKGERTDFDRELFAQGAGNTLAGLLGGLPITGVIVRSSANVEAGAKTRWSAVMHGVWLLVMVAALPFLLERIPVASLAAVLVYIGWRLVDPKAIRLLRIRGRGEVAIYVVTVAAIVATNLLEGLLIGLALSVLKLAYTFSRLDADVTEGPEGRTDITLSGSATFVTLPKLARAIEQIPEDHEVHVHLEHLDYVDHACLDLLADQERQREGRGGRLVIEWAELERRAKGPRSGPRWVMA